MDVLHIADDPTADGCAGDCGCAHGDARVWWTQGQLMHALSITADDLAQLMADPALGFPAPLPLPLAEPRWCVSDVQRWAADLRAVPGRDVVTTSPDASDSSGAPPLLDPRTFDRIPVPHR